MTDTRPAAAKDGNESRPSWSSIPILVFYFIIAALVPYIGRAAGVLALVLLGACLWMAVSRKQYEQLRRSYPSYPRGDYILNSLIHYVVIPWGVMLILTGVAHFIR